MRALRWLSIALFVTLMPVYSFAEEPSLEELAAVHALLNSIDSPPSAELLASVAADPAAVLLALVEHPAVGQRQRRAALSSLYLYPTDEVEACYLRQLEGGEPQMRSLAALGLARAFGERALQPLSDHLSDPQLAKDVVAALGVVGVSARPLLEQLANSNDDAQLAELARHALLGLEEGP
ncbi:MAG: hypothetical protein RBU37_17830 [Myxococcota bacterium]|jgi:hypothetical protein|nr:hypothetical protein [Myxococcota bacterium]